MMKLYERVTQDTWMQGGYHSLIPQERGCLRYHLTKLYGSNKGVEHKEVEHTLEAVIRLLYPERIAEERSTIIRFSKLPTIIRFNDHPDTTFEDVLRVCKVADV